MLLAKKPLFPFWKTLSFCGLVIISFVFHLNDGFADPDSFYHLKLAQDIYEKGILTQFDWLPFTVLQHAYTDHHFLYHILLSLFLAFFSPLWAMKICTIVLAILTICLFYFILKRYKLPFPLFLTFILAFSGNYIFRLHLGKTVALANIFMLLSFVFLFERRYFALFLLSFLYVWVYGGFVLLFVFIFFFMCAHTGEQRPKTISSLWHTFFSKDHIYLICTTILGVLMGLIINPYFPENMTFYYHQIVQIGVINKQHLVLVGMEWSPYDIWPLFAAHVPVFLLFIGCSCAFFLRMKKMDYKTIFFWLLSFFFLFFTLKSKRYIEYLVPVMLLFSAFALSRTCSYASFGDMYRAIRRYWIQKATFAKKCVILFLILYFYIALTAFSAKSFWETYTSLQNVFPESLYAQASSYIFTHSMPGDIVFHSAFDEFPLLLYHNDKNRYISGLDSTFFYDEDPEKYQLWQDMVLGKVPDNLYNVLKTDFQAKFIFISNKWPALNPYLHADPRIVPVYVDSTASVYQLR